jgi:hypothetical protein
MYHRACLTQAVDEELGGVVVSTCHQQLSGHHPRAQVVYCHILDAGLQYAIRSAVHNAEEAAHDAYLLVAKLINCRLLYCYGNP